MKLLMRLLRLVGIRIETDDFNNPIVDEFRVKDLFFLDQKFHSVVYLIVMNKKDYYSSERYEQHKILCYTDVRYNSNLPNLLGEPVNQRITIESLYGFKKFDIVVDELFWWGHKRNKKNEVLPGIVEFTFVVRKV